MKQNNMVFCTLFDSRYLDKGLVMYESLILNAVDFKLYVVAFDELCLRILSNYANDKLIVISLEQFESEELLEAKKNRSAKEYCWTCSCHTIKYVLETYHEPCCTYIDADLYFFQTPQVLLDEIERAGCDVSIIRHNFTESREKDALIKNSGEYCVEFNTFYATENGKKALQWWCDQCLECCTENRDGSVFGDQKYMEQMKELFQEVHVIEHMGAGVAPWNLARFTLDGGSRKGSEIILRDKDTDNIWPLIFYHYHNICYLSKDKVDVGLYLSPGGVSEKLIHLIYTTYLKKLKQTREELKQKFDFDLNDIEKEKYKNHLTLAGYFLYLVHYEKDFMTSCIRFFRMLCRRHKSCIKIN